MACVIIFIDKETKTQTIQIVQVLNPELGFEPTLDSNIQVQCSFHGSNGFLR